MIHLAALIAITSASVQPSAPAKAIQVQGAPDSAEQRAEFRSLVTCIAKARPRWARQTLALPYLSDAQAGVAAQALTGRDSCIGDDKVDLTFRTSTLVGSLAEHFIENLDSRALARMERALNTAAPLNGSEDFALCVAARNPSAARQLALSQPGSGAETEAAQQLAGKMASCTRPDEDLTVDVQALRALTATALYRAMTPINVASN